MMMARLVMTMIVVCAMGVQAWAAPLVEIAIDPRLKDRGPFSGRLVVSLLSADSALYRENSALDAPFFRQPQPMFGTDVQGLEAGTTVELTDEWTWFPEPPSELNPGFYRVAAWLDRSRADSDWKREEGNLYSREFTLRVEPDGDVPTLVVVLSETVDEPEMPERDGVRVVEAGGLRAAVVEPIGYDPEKRYATIYRVPGFGGTHRSAVSDADRRTRMRMDDPRRQLYARCFVVHLDPEGPNGHHLFADSANNGDVGERLVTELIPAIERAYPSMRTEPGARLVTGHSSGGWSSLWLALTYPEVFGAVWSSAPDPVDFRAFQQANLYQDENAYVKAGSEVVSYRSRGLELMSVRQENLMEEVLGPGNVSGQQWDSWWAVFAPKGEDGEPRAPFDALTGAIDHEVAERMRPYDIGHLVRTDPARYLPLFRDRVRLVVGDADNYYLEGAVRLLKDDLARLSAEREEPDAGHRVVVVPGADHGTVRRSAEQRAWPREMLEHLASLGSE